MTPPVRSRLAAAVATLLGISCTGAIVDDVDTEVDTSAAVAAAPLRVDGRHFRDASGGVVVLRGVNVAGNSKVPPFRPVTGPAFFDPLPGFGMNVVRLLFTWEAYEPSRGVYDESYLDYYAAAVDAAASRGLYVIVDVHQDAFSRASIGGCGEGLPMWAVPPWVARATPDNGPRCSNWALRAAFDAGMHMTWTSFYRDSVGARTRYLRMVERVATRLARHDGVIGYDMLNEPWGDEATEITRLYEDAAVAIRRGHPSAILFVSPHAVTGGGIRTRLSRPTFDNFAYAPHFYDASIAFGDAWDGDDLGEAFANLPGVADEWGVPLFVGEHGARVTTTNGRGYVAAVYDQLDLALASGAQWVFTPGWTPERKDGWNDENLSIADPTGAPRAHFAPRPYPRRIAGTPTHFSVVLGAPGTKPTIDLQWEHDPAAGATELFVPAQGIFGDDGPVITTSGVACALSAGIVRCTSSVAGAKQVTLAGD